MPTGSITIAHGGIPITIVDNATVSSFISFTTVASLRVTRLSIGLVGLSHGFSDDLDFLITGPDGRNLEFWSDAGGANVVAGTFSISDTASVSLSDNGANVPGSYKPTDYTSTGGVETSGNWSGVASIPINHPAPAGAASFASAFGGAWLGGTTIWALNIRDDLPGGGAAASQTGTSRGTFASSGGRTISTAASPTSCGRTTTARRGSGR